MKNRSISCATQRIGAAGLLVWIVLQCVRAPAMPAGNKRNPLPKQSQSSPRVAQPSAQVFLSRLLHEQSKGERIRLLQGQRALVTVQLVQDLYRSGEELTENGETDKALHLNDIALDAASVLKNRAELGWVYNFRGNVFRSQRQLPQAEASYAQALKLLRETHSKDGEASALNNLGVVYFDNDEYEKAAQHFNAALPIFRALKLGEEEAMTLHNLGKVQRATGRYVAALANFDASIKLFQKLVRENSQGLPDARRQQATVSPRAASELRRAGARVDTGLRLLQQVNEVLIEAGLTREATGNYSRAIQLFESALSISKSLENKRQEAKAWNNLGNVYHSLGRYAEALQAYESSLKLETDTANRAGQARATMNIGVVRESLGQYSEAMTLYARSFGTFQELKMLPEGAAALNSMANVARASGHNDDALKAYNVILNVYRELGLKPQACDVYNDVGIIHRTESHYSEALQSFDKGLSLAHEMKDPIREARIRHNIGNVYLSQHKPGEAIMQFETALRVTEPLGDADEMFRAHWGIGDAHRDQQQWQAAAESYRKAIKHIEYLRVQTKEQSLQTSFFEQYTGPYFLLAQCLLEMNQAAEALDVSEQAKARTLVDLMQNDKVSVTKAMTDGERRQEQDLNDAITALTVQLDNAQARGGLQRVEDLSHRRDAARSAYDEFRQQLFLRHPELQTQRAHFQPASRTQLNQTLFATEPNLCILSYLVGEDETILFVLTRGAASSLAALKVYRVPLTRTELLKHVNDFRMQCETAGGQKRNARAAVAMPPETDYHVEAHALYQALLAPASAELSGKTHLLIVPDGALHSLPFQALMDSEDKFLIEHCAISYAPSITALLKMRQVAANREHAINDRNANLAPLPLLAIGRPAFNDTLPDLPATEAEVTELGQLFGPAAEVLTGRRATKIAAKAKMNNARYLHFATHGLVNEKAPMYSAIALSPEANDDGLLEARELLDMNLRADLVVLSACETALGKQTSGEGVLGLTWALFVAGTPSSLVTQWSVDDTITSVLMVDFYRRLRERSNQDKVSVARALQEAQLAMLHDEKTHHPYYWAPFILAGDWQ